MVVLFTAKGRAALPDNRVAGAVDLERPRALRRVVGAVVLCAAAVAFSITYVDRPVALFMAAHVRERIPFIAMAAIANLPGPLASLYLVWIGVSLAAALRPEPKRRRNLTLAIATLVAIMLKDQLKFAFGRVWPRSHPFPGIYNHPSFIRNHVFGFFPFHGGTSFASFPSGHATAIAAPMAVLWALSPTYRPLWIGVAAVAIAGLIAADFHFVSDTIAGAALGIAVAATTVGIAYPRGAGR